jgi:hypothetical protein
MCFKNCFTNQLTLSLVALVSIAASITGCGGGGGGGGAGGPAQPPGIPTVDLHADTPFGATKVFADGGIITGAINLPGDVDFFQLNMTEGVYYTIQLEGFDTREPDLGQADGQAFGRIGLSVLKIDGFTQLFNSTGTDEGTPYDIEAVGIGTGTFVGDSRVSIVCPATGAYYFAIGANEVTNVGNYEVKVASSQVAFVPGRVFTFGGRPLYIIDTSGADAFVAADETRVDGFATVAGYEQGLIASANLPVNWGISRLIRLKDAMGMFDDDPQTPALHLHIGHPSTNPNTQIAVNNTPGDPPHPSIVAVDLPIRRSPGKYTETRFAEFMATDRGKEVRVPIEVDIEYEITAEGGMEGIATFDLSSGIARGGGALDLTDQLVRTITGWDFYLDVHWTNDLDLDPRPIAQSLPHGDIYQMFESDLVATPPGFTIPPSIGLARPVTAELPLGFLDILYSSSLSRFQMQNRIYTGFVDSTSTAVVSTPAHSYEFMNLAVHAGGVGEVGPKLFDVGLIPPNQFYPDHDIQFFNSMSTPNLRNYNTLGFTDYEPGLQNPIGEQLTNEEINLMREAFYGGGFYLEVTNGFGVPVVRAEGNALEWQIVPNDVLQPFSRTGTAYTRGTASFVTEYAGGAVTVIANGENLGQITSPIDGDVPACGEGGLGEVVSAKFIPQEYYYKAFAADGTEWDGFFTVPDAGCTTISLEAPSGDQ